MTQIVRFAIAARTLRTALFCSLLDWLSRGNFDSNLFDFTGKRERRLFPVLCRNCCAEILANIKRFGCGETTRNCVLDFAFTNQLTVDIQFRGPSDTFDELLERFLSVVDDDRDFARGNGLVRFHLVDRLAKEVVFVDDFATLDV